jgi:predicted dienelactone hydrolase
VDSSRRVVLPDGRSQTRTLVTELRYPLASTAAGLASGPFPLIVFGHGFAVTPALYATLLDAWTRAGFVVAAPVFPLGNANAPGGPDESDLHNQPRDVSFVISSLLHAARAGGPLAGLIDPQRIAVAGQSDGGDTALAVAYDPRFRDRRVRAAVILSGAEIPGLGQFAFPRPGPALLATQGSADTINLPAETDLFFAAAHPPKFLLRIAGASHLGPYTRRGPELALIERVTIRFLRRYLAGEAQVRLPLSAQGAGGILEGVP